MPSRNLLIFGSDTAPVPPLRLRAGPLAMCFDPETGFLRWLCLGPTEVVRAIYVAVRDRNWGTVPPRLEELSLKPGPDSFRLTFGASCHQDGIDFYWRGAVTGAPDGTVSFEFDGEARSAFLSNRVGFCVLHPLAGCVGQPCEVEHTDGSVEQGVFPRFISPHQPFTGIRALRHTVREGLQVEVRFEGEVFEMEDQRNWTDASFKTYCTPLALPFPARVEKGQRLRQCVSVKLIGTAPETTALPAPAGANLVVPDRPASPLPPVGLGLASHGQPLASREIERLKFLRLSHLRADLELAGPTWRQTLLRATSEANHLGCGLHLALFLSARAETELVALLGALREARPPVLLWLVFHTREAATSERWVSLAKVVLDRFSPDIPLAAGTNANFAELNRNRPSAETGVFPCFSVSPQVHAFDHASLIENLEAQPQAVAAAGRFSPWSVVVSPITLKLRFNPVATGQERAAAPDELPPTVDRRQMSLFGAAWTLGSLAALAATGRVHSLTYYETTGWRGVMETEAGSPLPSRFPSAPAMVFPVFHVLAGLAGFHRVAPVPTPATLAALALFEGERRRLLVANLTADPQPVRAQAGPADARWRVLDETNVESALREPESFWATDAAQRLGGSGPVELTLNPHAFACLDLGSP